MNIKKEDTQINYIKLEDINVLDKEKDYAYYIECDKENYHMANTLGMGLYDGNNLYYIKNELIKDAINLLKDKLIYTYDLKKNICLLNDLELPSEFDLMIGAYLLNYQIKDDLAVIMNKDGITIPFYEDIIKKNIYKNIWWRS